jgi:hypothetical protein
MLTRNPAKSQQNRAERRRQAAKWRKDMRQIYRESRGLLNGRVIRPEHFAAALLGPLTDAADLQDIRAVIDWFPMAAKADPPPLCLCCDAELSADGATIPHAFFVMAAHGTADVTRMIVSGVCPACAAHDNESIMKAALLNLRKCDPTMRRLDPAHMPAAAGHA